MNQCTPDQFLTQLVGRNEQLPCKITKQVKNAMLTYNEKFLANLLCLEESRNV
jgi:hypothetical protein